VVYVTIYRWVQRFTPLLIYVARPCRHAPGDRWFVDETYVKGAGRWVYLYRAIDQFGQVIDVLVSEKRDLAATRRFFTRALEHGPRLGEVITDKAAVYPPVLDELAPGAWYHTERYANNRVEADHDRLKSRLRPTPRHTARVPCPAHVNQRIQRSTNCDRTMFKGCLIAKSMLQYTVHCGRRNQNFQVLDRPQSWHWPRLFKSCRRSNTTVPASNRIVCSVSSSAAIGSPSWSWSAR
jgi:hypothetical protein